MTTPSKRVKAHERIPWICFPCALWRVVNPHRDGEHWCKDPKPRTTDDGLHLTACLCDLHPHVRRDRLAFDPYDAKAVRL